MTGNTQTVLANIPAEKAKAFAMTCAQAATATEGAKRVLLSTVAQAVAALTVPVNATQFDKQLRPELSEAFKQQSAAGFMSESTANQYVSRIKTAALAILNKVAEPLAGETFWDFYDRATPLLAAHRGPDGQPVWDKAAKAKGGRPSVGKGQGKKTGGAVPAVVAQANAAATEGPYNPAATEGGPLAGALILARGHEHRAFMLLYAATTYADQFDKWAETAISDDDKATIALRLTARRERMKATEPKTANPQPTHATAGEAVTDTALGAALVKAEGNRNRNRNRNRKPEPQTPQAQAA